MISGHLWAIGYEDMARAEQVRDEIITLGCGTRPYLYLDDIAVVVRQPDGSFTFNREPFPTTVNILGCTALGLLVGLVIAAPLVGATVGAALGSVGSLIGKSVGIEDDFVRAVEKLMAPGTSALFVLDHEGHMDMILHRIRGLGGTVLKTNVDAERAKLIQATLADVSDAVRPDAPPNPTA